MTLRPALLPLSLLAALAAAPLHAQSVAGEPSNAPKVEEANAPVVAATPMPKPPAPRGRTMQEILDASDAGDWRPLDPQNTLLMDLPGGRVVIELAPQFAPAHVGNIRALVKGGYFDRLSINRGHDGFVVQWGDANGEDPAKARPLGAAQATLPAEFTAPAANVPFTPMPDRDGWAAQVGFSNGMPAARDPGEGLAWPTHCYGVVGAGRGLAPDSSNGTELYVVIGQSPRQLDRNITTVGRVVQGMELLSVLPRGPMPLGFYEDPRQRTPIRRVRLLADVPANERTALQILRTDTATWDALIESRRNRQDDFYHRPAGNIDVCNVPVPVRAEPGPAAK